MNPPPPPPLAVIGYAMQQGVTFRTTATLSKMVVGLLIAMAFLEAGDAIFSAWDTQRMAGFKTEDEYMATVGVFEIAMLIWGVIYLFAFILCTIFWCIWQHRVHSNLIPLGRDRGPASPGWGVGCWFVPIMNLFKPYYVVKHVFITSEKGSGNDLHRIYSETGVVGWWWATWILASILGKISLSVSLKSSDMDVLRWMMGVNVVVSVLGLASAILAIWIVREIQNRQTATLAHSQTTAVGI